LFLPFSKNSAVINTYQLEIDKLGKLTVLASL